MSRKENNLKVIFAGRLPEGETPSGPELTAARIFAEHSRGGHSPVFLQYFFDGRKFSLFKKLFGREETVLPEGRVLMLGLFRILPTVKKLKPGIIHLVTFERFAVILYLYRMLFRVKIIYNSHGVINYENKVIKGIRGFRSIKDKFCERIFLKHSDKIVFPSVLTLDIAQKYYSIDEERTLILPGGVDNIFFNEKDKAEPSGRLKAVIHYKNSLNSSGLKLLFDILATAELQLSVYIITRADITIPESKTVKFIKTKYLPGNELAEFYRDKDIFLSLNSYDTFSIATAEAMASGLIPVITSETGISRYIESGLNGFAFDHHFKHDLVNILNKLINMPPDTRNNISTAARNSVKSLYWHNVYQMYSGIYGTMLK